jgi:SAM-dependent methyltransferase
MTEEIQGEALEPTGERLVPERQHGEVVHAEHLARYLLAAQLAESRRVLDAACGEGYGTNLIAAAGAASAVGIDLDDQTVAHARRRYPSAEFVSGDVRQLPFEDGAFDLVVSFETIEHVTDPERVLNELRRVLADEGVLLISTPNKTQYLVENEFHEREFTHQEFAELLNERFPNVELLLQQNWLASTVLSLELAGDAAGRVADGTQFAKVRGIQPGEELYTLAVCGRHPAPSLRPVAVAAGLDESHALASRLVDTQKTAEHWHGEYLTNQALAAHMRRLYEDAERTLTDVYGSVWWRMTSPLRGLADRLRRRDG